MRECKTCHEDKPIGDFPTYRAKGVIGRRHVCRVCWNVKWTPVVVAHNKKYYDENRSGYRDRQLIRTRAAHRTSGAAIKHNQRNLAYAVNHPERKVAKQAVSVAIRSGRLLRKPCEKCGSVAQAHHEDYSKPLDVMWLCPTHHGERHRLLNRGDPAEWPADLQVREFPGMCA